MALRIQWIATVVSLVAFGAACPTALAQRVQFSPTPGATVLQGGGIPAIAPAPQIMAPPATFDPYAMGGASATPPALFGPPADPFLGSAVAEPSMGLPGGTAFPAEQPGVLFPQGIGAPFVLPGVGSSPYLKAVQNLRFQYTYVHGGDEPAPSPNSLRTQDFEVGVTTTYPSFLYSEAPLLVAPGFIFHFWDGVDEALPDQAYSAFVDFAWNPHSRFANQISYELGLRLGIFSDFDALNRDSFRTQGAALAVLRVSPTVAVKLGVVYLDRVDIGLLPAGGIVWTPNECTRFDILFPNPKLSQYLTTLGNTTIWWYLKGEIGGDSWSVVTPNTGGLENQVDINDIRFIAGFDWTYPSGARGFFEAGYVFNREVVSSRLVPTIQQDDTFMLRAGLSF